MTKDKRMIKNEYILEDMDFYDSYLFLFRMKEKTHGEKS